MDILTTSAELQKIPKLKWYPWIGDKYFDLSPEERILIMGESHYSLNDPIKIKHWDTNKEQTKNVILDLLKDSFTSQTHSRFHKLLFENDTLEARERFYQYVGFINIVQRAMINYQKNYIEKPRKQDFRDGWEVILSTLKVLRPRYVLCIGVQAANSFDSINDSDIESKKLHWFDKINNTYPRKGIIKFKDGHECTFLFLKHMGRSISYKPWRTHIGENSEILKIISRMN